MNLVYLADELFNSVLIFDKLKKKWIILGSRMHYRTDVLFNRKSSFFFNLIEFLQFRYCKIKSNNCRAIFEYTFGEPFHWRNQSIYSS